jgi:hypothetical protein
MQIEHTPPNIFTFKNCLDTTPIKAVIEKNNAMKFFINNVIQAIEIRVNDPKSSPILFFSKNEIKKARLTPYANIDQKEPSLIIRYPMNVEIKAGDDWDIIIERIPQNCDLSIQLLNPVDYEMR